MQFTNNHSNGSEYHTPHLRGSTHLPVEISASNAERLISMVARSDARIHSLTEELKKVRELLDESNKALADAGIPYRQGNIRERISSYQVFRKIMTFPV